MSDVEQVVATIGLPPELAYVVETLGAEEIGIYASVAAAWLRGTANGDAKLAAVIAVAAYAMLAAEAGL